MLVARVRLEALIYEPGFSNNSKVPKYSLKIIKQIKFFNKDEDKYVGQTISLQQNANGFSSLFSFDGEGMQHLRSHLGCWKFTIVTVGGFLIYNNKKRNCE